MHFNWVGHGINGFLVPSPPFRFFLRIVFCHMFFGIPAVHYPLSLDLSSRHGRMGPNRCGGSFNEAGSSAARLESRPGANSGGRLPFAGRVCHDSRGVLPAFEAEIMAARNPAVRFVFTSGLFGPEFPFKGLASTRSFSPAAELRGGLRIQ